MDYKKAGVDIEAGYKSVELMKEHVRSTMRAEVLGGLGGFSGAFSLEKIKELIKNAGMELLAIYDAYTMEPPKEDSGRLTFVVREHGKMAV